MTQANRMLTGLAVLTLCIGLVSAAMLKPLMDQAAREFVPIQDLGLMNMYLVKNTNAYDQTIHELISATLSSSQLETLHSSVVIHWSNQWLFEKEAQPNKPCNIEEDD